MNCTRSAKPQLQRKVDVVPEHELNRHIREQVLREVVEL